MGGEGPSEIRLGCIHCMGSLGLLGLVFWVISVSD